ncbi:hypothetical protein B0H16DRAFT_802442 [Mycena metata]|uniref:Uncharacterized protein n=1 Tax=Mycena metata TaxID=1033252 RepID=A0AAD7NX92_9AGAR|nr:hypothetical protein B0H16DRAFT_802442 [Mycena metata]
MSSTRPGATPIRAITTPLRSTAAPPIPPPSALYIPLAKNVLQRRLARRIFPFTFAICLGVSVVWLAWMDGVGKMRVGRVIGATLGFWVGSVVPVVLVSKAYLTVTHTTASSPFLLLQKSFLAPGPLRARTLHALQAHVLGALAVLAIHAALDPAIPIFIRSRKHPYTPHPTLVLLTTTQLLFAALYVVRATLRDAWVWPFAASGSKVRFFCFYERTWCFGSDFGGKCGRHGSGIVTRMSTLPRTAHFAFPFAEGGALFCYSAFSTSK